MTHTAEQDRAAFEAKFKVPPGVTWELGMYLVEHAQQGSYQVERFLGQWEGWQAARRAPSVPVPQGWKMVPDANNMTDEQAEAICNLVSCCGGGAHEVYEAALAAAPQPPEDLKRENHATKPEAGCSVSNAETVAIAALEKVLRAIQRHLPPERIGERETIAEIISIVDPWPLGILPAPWKDHRTAALVNELRDCAAKYGQTQQLRERIAYIVAPLCAQLKAAEQAAVNQQLTTEAAPVQLPENLREGAPYDNPAFEALARDLGVWGAAQSAVCAQFWIAAQEQAARVAQPCEAITSLWEAIGFHTAQALETGNAAPGEKLHKAVDAVQALLQQTTTKGG